MTPYLVSLHHKSFYSLLSLIFVSPMNPYLQYVCGVGNATGNYTGNNSAANIHQQHLICKKGHSMQIIVHGQCFSHEIYMFYLTGLIYQSVNMIH